jgi:hypothetical protein
MRQSSRESRVRFVVRGNGGTRSGQEGPTSVGPMFDAVDLRVD